LPVDMLLCYKFTNECVVRDTMAQMMKVEANVVLFILCAISLRATYLTNKVIKRRSASVNEGAS